MSTFSTDGLLRLQPQDLGRMTLTHLISRIDEEESTPTSRRGAGTRLSGYTEWVSVQEPGLTLGWDWELEPDRHRRRSSAHECSRGAC